MLNAVTPYRRIVFYILFAVGMLVVAAQAEFRAGLRAQDAKKNAAADEAGPSADPVAAPADDAVAAGDPASVAAKPAAASGASPGINAFKLAMDGGIFMYPIYGFSILGLAMAIERFLALRRDRVVPERLVSSLGQLGSAKGGFDPRKAYRICQENPSAAASVIRAMLLKVGRPHSEVEHTVIQASEREANRLYGNVRWLNLCAAVSPLIGLLGTVQGMIMAFYGTTQLAPGANKALELANGIYVALVTTFAGLCVAIPASVCSHYFEARIQNLFLEIDELLFSLLPQIERYEGRVRFGRQLNDTEPTADESAEAPPVQPRAAAVAPK